MSGSGERGANVNGQHGKRPGLWLAITFLALGGALAPAACGGTESSPSDSPRSTPTSVMQSPSPVAIKTADVTENPLGERTSWGENQEITNLFARVEKPVEMTKAPTGKGSKIVVVQVTLENESLGHRKYNARTFTAYDQAGHSYKPSHPTVLSSGRLAPGEVVKGFLRFEVPSDATVERVVWTFPAFEWVNEWTWE